MEREPAAEHWRRHYEEELWQLGTLPSTKDGFTAEMAQKYVRQSLRLAAADTARILFRLVLPVNLPPLPANAPPAYREALGLLKVFWSANDETYMKRYAEDDVEVWRKQCDEAQKALAEARPPLSQSFVSPGARVYDRYASIGPRVRPATWPYVAAWVMYAIQTKSPEWALLDLSGDIAKALMLSGLLDATKFHPRHSSEQIVDYLWQSVPVWRMLLACHKNLGGNFQLQLPSGRYNVALPAFLGAAPKLTLRLTNNQSKAVFEYTWSAREGYTRAADTRKELPQAFPLKDLQSLAAQFDDTALKGVREARAAAPAAVAPAFARLAAAPARVVPPPPPKAATPLRPPTAKRRDPPTVAANAEDYMKAFVQGPLRNLPTFRDYRALEEKLLAEADTEERKAKLARLRQRRSDDMVAFLGELTTRIRGQRTKEDSIRMLAEMHTRLLAECRQAPSEFAEWKLYEVSKALAGVRGTSAVFKRDDPPELKAFLSHEVAAVHTPAEYRAVEQPLVAELSALNVAYLDRLRDHYGWKDDKKAKADDRDHNFVPEGSDWKSLHDWVKRDKPGDVYFALLREREDFEERRDELREKIERLETYGWDDQAAILRRIEALREARPGDPEARREALAQLLEATKRDHAAVLEAQNTTVHAGDAKVEAGETDAFVLARAKVIDLMKAKTASEDELVALADRGDTLGWHIEALEKALDREDKAIQRAAVTVRAGAGVLAQRNAAAAKAELEAVRATKRAIKEEAKRGLKLAPAAANARILAAGKAAAQAVLGTEDELRALEEQEQQAAPREEEDDADESLPAADDEDDEASDSDSIESGEALGNEAELAAQNPAYRQGESDAAFMARTADRKQQALSKHDKAADDIARRFLGPRALAAMEVAEAIERRKEEEKREAAKIAAFEREWAAPAAAPTVLAPRRKPRAGEVANAAPAPVAPPAAAAAPAVPPSVAAAPVAAVVAPAAPVADAVAPAAPARVSAAPEMADAKKKEKKKKAVDAPPPKKADAVPSPAAGGIRAFARPGVEVKFDEPRRTRAVAAGRARAENVGARRIGAAVRTDNPKFRGIATQLNTTLSDTNTFFTALGETKDPELRAFMEKCGCNDMITVRRRLKNVVATPQLGSRAAQIADMWFVARRDVVRAYRDDDTPNWRIQYLQWKAQEIERELRREPDARHKAPNTGTTTPELKKWIETEVWDKKAKESRLPTYPCHVRLVKLAEEELKAAKAAGAAYMDSLQGMVAKGSKEHAERKAAVKKHKMAVATAEQKLAFLAKFASDDVDLFQRRLWWTMVAIRQSVAENPDLERAAREQFAADERRQLMFDGTMLLSEKDLMLHEYWAALEEERQLILAEDTLRPQPEFTTKCLELLDQAHDANNVKFPVEPVLYTANNLLGKGLVVARRQIRNLPEKVPDEIAHKPEGEWTDEERRLVDAIYDRDAALAEEHMRDDYHDNVDAAEQSEHEEELDSDLEEDEEDIFDIRKRLAAAARDA